MQSYPQELLVQQQPLMFIAGLDATQPEPYTSTSMGISPAQPSAALETERRSSETTSPQPPDRGKPSVPAVVVSEENGSSAQPVKVVVEEEPASDQFEDLKGSLRKLFGQRGGKGKIWQTPGRGDTFKMVMVDKNVRLPTRKVLPQTSAPTSQSPTPHSPLSPLTTTSPLYPDGIISPIWMRKHSDMIPSVFVLFLRLLEFSANESSFSSLAGSPMTSLGGTAPNSPPAATSTDDAQQFPFQGETRKPADIPLPDLEKRRKEAERLADEELVKIIAERRRKLVERGIKFTIVLMTGRDMLDDPSLDGRLSTIRRQSGLDSRASLFVLTPVPDEDLVEFVASLQDALRDSALDYYGAHYKRNRRKRQRLPANPLTIPYPLTIDPATHTRPLAAQGWAVRYDYKAAVFAEMRGEIDVARRHLQDSWTELAKMFSSTSTLPPRTKRWAEAKVAADCIAVKICKLCLYKNETVASLAFFHQHLGRFGELSRGWGIGEETFEFWSWVARQYRIFAELVEMGVSSGLRIPTTVPSYVPLAAPTTLPHTQLTPQELVSHNNPLVTLQHPGYYYYTAANCTVQRRSRFLAALEEAENPVEDGAGHVSPSPGFPNEKKIDHAAIIIELFTKAYGLFKDQRRQQLRMSLYIAYRIAAMYSEAGQHEMAMKFFERISKNYRRECWDPITWSIRDTWYDCAQRTGSVETAVKLLLQMMSPGGSRKQDDPSQLQEDMMSILTTTAPSSNDPLEIDMDAETPLISATISYPRDSVPVGQRAPFHIKLSASPSAQFDALSFDSIELHFSTDRPAVVIQGSEGAEEHIRLGNIALDDVAISGYSGSLSFKPGQTTVLNGSLSSASPSVGGINKVVFTLSRGQWKLRLNATPGFQTASASSGRSVPTVRFAKAPPRIRMEVTGPPTAYTSERIPITVEVMNEDDVEMNSVLHLDLQGLDRGDDFMLLGENGKADPTGEPSWPLSLASGQSKTIQCRFQALLPGVKSLRLLLSVRQGDETAQAASLSQSIQVDISEPFRIENAVTYSPLQHGRIPLLALGSALEELYKAEVVTTVELGAGADIVIRKVQYVASPAPHIRLVHDTLSELSLDVAQAWRSGDAICSSALFSLAIPETLEAFAPTQLDIEWNSATDSSPPNVFHAVLPQLIMPQSADYVDAVLHFPQRVHMLHPFEVSLVVTNTHNTAAAPSLAVHLASDDNFVWEGGRQTKLPLLLPGGQWTLPLSMTALQTGWQALPSMRLADGLPDSQREIPVKSAHAPTAESGQDIHVYVQPA